jgi:prepilin-type N-terminal cleavage/methylation domain-containing protein/prepilin-type processing-associated H-X9-DG protein
MKARKKSGLGFTLIELLVTITIIAILASLLLGAVSRAKSEGANARCKSNLHQLGMALSMYVSDTGAYPRGELQVWPRPGMPTNMRGFMYGFWFGRLFPYCSVPYPPDPYGIFTEFPDVFNCPGSPKDPRYVFGQSMGGRDYARVNAPAHRQYGYNMVGAMDNRNGVYAAMAGGDVGSGLGLGTECREGSVVAPENMIAIGCVQQWTDNLCLTPVAVFSDNGYLGPASWHNGRGNIVFCDDHVEIARTNVWIAKNEKARARWNRDNQPHPEFW